MTLPPLRCRALCIGPPVALTASISIYGRTSRSSLPTDFWHSMRTGATAPPGRKSPAPSPCPSWQSNRVTRRARPALWARSAAPMTFTVLWMNSSPACMSRWRVCRGVIPIWAAPPPVAQWYMTAASFYTVTMQPTLAAADWSTPLTLYASTALGTRTMMHRPARLPTVCHPTVPCVSLRCRTRMLPH